MKDVFRNCGCLSKGSLTLHWPPLSQFWKVEELLRRDKSCQFWSPKVAKKKFLCSNFEVQKYRTKRSGLLMFSEIGKLHAKKIVHFTPAGECVQSVQSLEERLEDLHSLFLNFCLTKFLRTIPRAFVQVLDSFANWFPNTRVWISPNTYLWIYKIFIWA